MTETPPYRTVQQALRNAFGDPRCNFGAVRWDGVRYGSGNGLNSLENAGQDGQAMRVIKNAVNDHEMLVLTLWYAYAESQPAIWMAAVEPLASGLLSIYPHHTYKKALIIRWADRYLPPVEQPDWLRYSVKDWSRELSASVYSLRNIENAINQGLDRIKKIAETRAHDALVECGMLGGGL